MARRTIVEQEPQRDDQRELQDNEALAAHVANEPEPSTERRPQRAPMSPEMLAEKQAELRALEEQLEQNQEQLRDLLETKAKSGDMKRVAELTKESAKLSKKIAELTFALRQEKNAQELQKETKPKKDLGMDPVTKMEQRLRALSDDLATTKNEKQKQNIWTEVDELIPALAKVKDESADMLRARFVVNVEDREKDEALVEEGKKASRQMGARQKVATERSKTQELAAKEMLRKPGEYKKQTARLEELAHSIETTSDEKIKSALKAEAERLIPVLAKAQGVSEAALRANFFAAQELVQENQNALADAAAQEFRTAAETRKKKEKEKKQITSYTNKARQGLANRKTERAQQETYQALHDEMRQITEQKDAKAMAAFYESLKRLARDSKSIEQAAAEKLLAELNAETSIQARKKEQREMADIDKGFEELHANAQKEDDSPSFKQTRATREATSVRAEEQRESSLSENITKAITDAEADYFREQAKGPLTREEMRDAGLSGVGDMVGWRSAEERRQAMKTREELMNQLNAITWKFWQAPGLRRQIAEIDRNEVAFQNDISGRLAKRSMKKPRSANTENRPGGGIFPRM